MLQKKEVTDLTFREPPHYYEVRTELGQRYCHCGTMKDVLRTLELHPTFTYEKMYLPQISNPIVNVSSEVVVDKELPEQKILPESESIPLDLN